MVSHIVPGEGHPQSDAWELTDGHENEHKTKDKALESPRRSLSCTSFDASEEGWLKVPDCSELDVDLEPYMVCQQQRPVDHKKSTAKGDHLASNLHMSGKRPAVHATNSKGSDEATGDKSLGSTGNGVKCNGSDPPTQSLSNVARLEISPVADQAVCKDSKSTKQSCSKEAQPPRAHERSCVNAIGRLVRLLSITLLLCLLGGTGFLLLSVIGPASDSLPDRQEVTRYESMTSHSSTAQLRQHLQSLHKTSKQARVYPPFQDGNFADALRSVQQLSATFTTAEDILTSAMDFRPSPMLQESVFDVRIALNDQAAFLSSNVMSALEQADTTYQALMDSVNAIHNLTVARPCAASPCQPQVQYPDAEDPAALIDLLATHQANVFSRIHPTLAALQQVEMAWSTADAAAVHAQKRLAHVSAWLLSERYSQHHSLASVLPAVIQLRLTTAWQSVSSFASDLAAESSTALHSAVGHLPQISEPKKLIDASSSVVTQARRHLQSVKENVAEWTDVYVPERLRDMKSIWMPKLPALRFYEKAAHVQLHNAGQWFASTVQQAQQKLARECTGKDSSADDTPVASQAMLHRLKSIWGSFTGAVQQTDMHRGASISAEDMLGYSGNEETDSSCSDQSECELPTASDSTHSSAQSTARSKKVIDEALEFEAATGTADILSLLSHAPNVMARALVRVNNSLSSLSKGTLQLELIACGPALQNLTTLCSWESTPVDCAVDMVAELRSGPVCHKVESFAVLCASPAQEHLVHLLALIAKQDMSDVVSAVNLYKTC